ncbi:MAG TPA: biosynthetic arginine decarboxylase, partial [Chthoniobacterales bacterium]
MSESWDIPSAIALYNIDRWGGGYFTINRQGNVQVMPTQDERFAIDLMEVIQEARDRKLTFPLVIRFQDLLRHRVETINKAFAAAIAEAGYNSPYKGVFPIKVNQLREVVEEIMDAGRPYDFGLEAGSKPELIAALAGHDNLESLIICNGYKDTSYIRTALLGRKLGKRVIMVVEKLEEVHHIVQVSKEMNVIPFIGLRVRLQSKGFGKWATSGGENAKFGLSTADLIAASLYLKAQGLGEALRLVHFHVGSQVPDIGVIKRAVREGARFFAKLHQMGHPMEFMDVGGGLGVDYDGSRTAFDSSMNYTLQEYARDVVYNIMDVCDSEKVPHPTIVSESGRAIVAHHSVLVVEALGAIEKGVADLTLEVQPTDPKILQEIVEIQRTLTKQNRMENLHDAQQVKEQAQSMFELGLLDLQSKAKIETIYWQIALSIVELCRGMRYVPDEVKELEIALCDQYLCNFSVFQSLLDHWALGQLFPIMPVHNLEEPPDRNATLVDITCDSDGKVSKFIDLQDVKETLPLHRIKPGEPYYLGFFLMGAYQDIMGDLHNLFGRVNEMHLFLDEQEEAGWYIEEVIQGSTIGNVLSLTQWDQIELVRRLKTHVDAAIKSDR